MSKTSKLSSQLPLQSLSSQSKIGVTIASLSDAWHDDLTKAWAKTQAYGGIIAASVIEGIQQLSTILNDGVFKGYLDTLHAPQWVPAVCAVIGIIAFISLPSKKC